MCKIRAFCLAAMAAMMVSVNVQADVYNVSPSVVVDYKTEYYMTVFDSKADTNVYVSPKKTSRRLNDEPLPSGYAFLIEGEKKDDDGRIWGYVKYDGKYGYVLTEGLAPATLTEAIDAEKNALREKQVDYKVKVETTEEIPAYRGPGEKFGAVKDISKIEKGMELHIVRELESAEGVLWGMTMSLEKDAWLNLDDLVRKNSETVQMDRSETEVTTDSDNLVQITAKPEKSTETEEATDSQTVEVTPTVTVSPTPEATPTVSPTPEATPTVSPTPEATPTVSPTPEATPTVSPTPEATPTVSPTPEPTETVALSETPMSSGSEGVTPTVAGVSSANKKVDDSLKIEKLLFRSMIIWITIAIILLIIVMIQLLKRKK